MPPNKRKPVRSVKQISQVKKAVPKAATKKTAKRTMSPPTKGGKPRAVKDMGRPGPLGQKNGSGSIPYQGPGPMGQGVY